MARALLDLDALATPERLLDQLGPPLDPETYDWSAARPGTLRDDEVFALTYAAQVEWATEGTFLSLDIAEDPLVRRFLRIWLEQEVVHAQILARLLQCDGTPVVPLHQSRTHRAGARRGRVVNRAARLLVGHDVYGVHMTWGAVNELTTLRFYQRLRARTAHPVLDAVLRDMIAQEARHYAFYRAMAVRMLDGNPRGQRIVRTAMLHLWRPVGAGLRSRADVQRLLADVFAQAPEVLARIDSAINAIPGLGGTDLIRRELART